MKRFLIFTLLVVPYIYITTVGAVIETSAPHFVKVYIAKCINQTAVDCSLEGTEVPSEESVTLKQKLLIPFISIKTYLKEYATKQAYTPEHALKIHTPNGTYCLWASESGVMCAKDPQKSISLDNWKAKKLLGITQQEHAGKKLYLASLAFRVINNKFKISLEPTGSK
jgi:hypothetical protein